MGIETALIATSIAATVVGGVTAAAGAQQQAAAQADAARYQAQVAENNRRIAEMNAETAMLNRQGAINDAIRAREAAEDARERGNIEAAQQRIRTRLLLGQQTAALAGAGVTVDQDSALDLARDTAGIGELDALTIRSNAEREALGFDQQSENFARAAENFGTDASSFIIQGESFAAESALQQSTARNVRTTGALQAGSALVSSFGTVADKWYQFRRS